MAEMGGVFWPKSGGFSGKNFGRFLDPITYLDESKKILTGYSYDRGRSRVREANDRVCGLRKIFSGYSGYA